MKGSENMAVKIDAHGLSQNEVQLAIDAYIASKNSIYLIQKQAEIDDLDRQIKELEDQLKST